MTRYLAIGLIGLSLTACAQDRPASHLAVSSARVTQADGTRAIELRVDDARGRFAARALDPRLVIAGQTLTEYRYENGDSTLVFTAPEPSSLPAAESVRLEWGAPGRPAVASEVVPCHFDPTKI